MVERYTDVWEHYSVFTHVTNRGPRGTWPFVFSWIMRTYAREWDKISKKQDRVVQSWVKLTTARARFEFSFSLKSISVLILFVYNLMIGRSKNSRENYPRKYFWTQERETWVKFNPGLSANRPSNNWAQFSGVLSHDLYWGHKTYKLKRFISQTQFISVTTGSWSRCTMIYNVKQWK